MRTVNRDELIWSLAQAMRAVSKPLLRELYQGTHEQQRRARAVLAGILVDKGLLPFEVLSNAPLPDVMGEEAFSRPVASMLGG